MDASIDDNDDNKNYNTKKYLCNGDDEHKILKITAHVTKSNCSLHVQQNRMSEHITNKDSIISST